MTPNEKVLICLSGGEGSTVMLDLISSGINKDDHKKLRISPHFFHIVGIEKESTKILDSLKEQCSKYDFELNFINISNYLSEEININQIENMNSNQLEEFVKQLSFLSLTSRNDLILKMKRILYIKTAKKLGCNTIFTAETTSTLATQLLSNLAIGRGSQVQNDIGFYDSRDCTVKILRPLKDISQDELVTYIKLKQLIIPMSCNSDAQEKSLQSVIKTFVVDLQQNFQGTISTVCKTADKLGVQLENHDEKCGLCQNLLIRKPNKLTAQEATNISMLVSSEKPISLETSDSVFCLLENKISSIKIPLNNRKLCYSCKSYSEIHNCNLLQLH